MNEHDFSDDPDIDDIIPDDDNEDDDDDELDDILGSDDTYPDSEGDVDYLDADGLESLDQIAEDESYSGDDEDLY